MITPQGPQSDAGEPKIPRDPDALPLETPPEDPSLASDAVEGEGHREGGPPEDQEDDGPKAFVLKEGKADAAVLVDYLATLSGKSVGALLDLIQARSSSVEVSEEEQEEILKAVFTRKRYEKTLSVFEGYKIIAVTLDDDDREWVETEEPAAAQRLSAAVRRRLQDRRLLAAAVTSVNGKELPEKAEARLGYWQATNGELVAWIVDAVHRFHKGVLIALANKALVGKS